MNIIIKTSLHFRLRRIRRGERFPAVFPAGKINGLINNLLPQQHRDTLSIVDIKATKSSKSEYNRNSFSLSLDGYRKVLKPDWQFLLDSTDPYRELNKGQELLLEIA